MRSYNDIQKEFEIRRKEIAQEYANGAKISELHDKYGLSRERIYSILRKENVALRAN